MPEGSNQGPDQTETPIIKIGDASPLEKTEGLIKPEGIVKSLSVASLAVRRSVGPGIPDNEIEEASQQARDATELMTTNAFPIEYLEITEAHKRLKTNLELNPWVTPNQAEKDLKRGKISETNNPEDLEQDEVPEYIRKYVEKLFPNFDKMYRGEFDTFDEKKDLTRGKILYFYSGEERNNESPYISINFIGTDFIINTQNIPEHGTSFIHANKADSVYNPERNKWKMDEIALALLKTKIRMEGVDMESNVFKNQLVEWSEDESRYITMQEAIENYAKSLEKAKTFKEKGRKKHETSTLPVTDGANNIVIARISKNSTYRIGESEIPISDALTHIEKGDELGKRIVRQEIVILDANRSLLVERGLLPRVANPPEQAQQ